MSNREYTYFNTVECSQTKQERIDMANPEHLALLRQGRDAWNAWREEYRQLQPDLDEADLTGANLSGADLSKADLSKANLSGANLSEADFRDASLNGANLSDTYLVLADLRGVDLSQADLYRANLSGAYLESANLQGANLQATYFDRSEAQKALLEESKGVKRNRRTTDPILHTELWYANLSQANLYEARLSGVSLLMADLSGAKLVRAILHEADLRAANLSQAYLHEANLSGADLNGANLSKANLSGANLNGANLTRANLSGANLSWATLVHTNLKRANLQGCLVYGIAAWDVELEGALQSNLIITPPHQPTITVDNLRIAQFIYLLLNNKAIRDVIDTITSKVVLILGRFTPERKTLLDAIKDELHKRNYTPVLFDFEKPASRDLTETVSTLAHMARFVIADITDAKSIPQELMLIVPNLPSVPVVPLILASQHEYGMFEHFMRFPWVLPVYRYTDEVNLLQSLQEKVITPAEQKAKELEMR
jgi:uncharacterized protein YjbI with pentapeptide repeats